MKICILSDSHDQRHLLSAAVEEAKQLGAEAVLHCGDVVAPSTLKVLKKFALPIHVIHGNNTGDLFHTAKLASEPDSGVHFYGQDAGITLAGKRIFIVHYPHYAYAIACTGEWDIVCFGHNHKPEARYAPTIKGTQTLLLNPGTVGGVGATPTYILADLGTMEFNIRNVLVPPVSQPDAKIRSHSHSG